MAVFLELPIFILSHLKQIKAKYAVLKSTMPTQIYEDIKVIWRDNEVS